MDYSSHYNCVPLAVVLPTRGSHNSCVCIVCNTNKFIISLPGEGFTHKITANIMDTVNSAPRQLLQGAISLYGNVAGFKIRALPKMQLSSFLSKSQTNSLLPKTKCPTEQVHPGQHCPYRVETRRKACNNTSTFKLPVILSE